MLKKPAQAPPEKHPLATSLEQNLTELQKIFDLCADIVFRKFTLNCEPSINAVAVYTDSMIDEKIGSETILKAIMQETTSLPDNVQITKSNAHQILQDRLLTTMSTKDTNDFLELVDFVLKGGVAIVIDGSPRALICFVGGSPGRSIEEPVTEPVVRGPRDGFVEDYKTNLSLIRRRIKSSRLKVELLEVGAISKTTVALCYIKGIVSSERGRIRQHILETIKTSFYGNNPREQQHAEQVSELSVKLGEALKLSSERLRELQIASNLHDIGKITIKKTTLEKTQPLSPDEWQEIKRHAENGYKILSSVNKYAGLAEFVLAHHECYDGTGYPAGLKGDGIPLAARIIATAEAYIYMTSDWPYRSRKSVAEAIYEIKMQAGKQFDPVIVDVLQTILNE
ncbi:MAG: spore germination protein [Desulfosporosinus sp.]|nr:spore germination protein [Desulfosporosinus sp.]